jgi:hypothetical protein
VEERHRCDDGLARSKLERVRDRLRLGEHVVRSEGDALGLCSRARAELQQRLVLPASRFGYSREDEHGEPARRASALQLQPGLDVGPGLVGDDARKRHAARDRLQLAAAVLRREQGNRGAQPAEREERDHEARRVRCEESDGGTRCDALRAEGPSRPLGFAPQLREGQIAVGRLHGDPVAEAAGTGVHRLPEQSRPRHRAATIARPRRRRRPAGRRGGGGCLGGALEALFGAGALADVLAWAEPQLGTHGALLVPEGVDARPDVPQLGGERGIMALGEGAVELGAALAGALDLRTDLIDCSHAHSNECLRSLIPHDERRMKAATLA